LLADLLSNCVGLPSNFGPLKGFGVEAVEEIIVKDFALFE
jgi:hypothetical protein